MEASIGCLVVVSENDPLKMVGIITERDCMRAVAENANGLSGAVLADIMTPNDVVITARMNISSENCFRIMLTNNIRHLPLVDDDFVISRVLSIKDVAASMISETERKIHEKEEEAEYWAWRAQNLEESQ